MNHNRVVIYSNGIAGFQRFYPAKANEKQAISLPVKREHLADVLASLLVFGDVQLTKPPTFDTDTHLDDPIAIDSTNVLEGLASVLSGAELEIEHAGKSVAGRLMGLHSEPESSGGATFHPKSMVILTSHGIQKLPIREIQSWRFTDPAIQSEIDKSLQRKTQTIKPNSTFVELELESQNDTEIVIQYTIPASAWKISYRILVSDSNAISFHGFAIVDNNTDDDWNNVIVSVVSGSPITFSTDLAESKTPARDHVSLVREQALGAVMAAGSQASEPDEMMAGAAAPSPKRMKLRSAPLKPAAINSASIEEVGDNAVFESLKPMDISANKSAIIPVFEEHGLLGKKVLFYSNESHPSHPYRAIDFENPLDTNLERGVCTVTEEGLYAGSCVIPTLQKTETRILPYSLEAGIQVIRESPVTKQTRSEIRIQTSRYHLRLRTDETQTYHFRSQINRLEELVLDATLTRETSEVQIKLILGEKVVEPAAVERNLHRIRIRFLLPPRAKCELKIYESWESQTQHAITFGRLNRYESPEPFFELISEKDLGFQEDARVIRIMELDQQLKDTGRKLSTLKDAKKRHLDRQERIRKNLQTAGDDSVSVRWRRELDEAEQEIRSIDEQESELNSVVRQQLIKEIQAQTNKLALEWIDSDSHDEQGTSNES